MSLTEDPRVLRAALISFVSAVGDSPAGAALCRRALCAIVGVGLVEIAATPPSPTLPVGAARALEEIAEALGRASLHAEYLAEKAAIMAAPPP